MLNNVLKVIFLLLFAFIMITDEYPFILFRALKCVVFANLSLICAIIFFSSLLLFKPFRIDPEKC